MLARATALCTAPDRRTPPRRWSDGACTIACGQEAPTFAALAEELGVETAGTASTSATAPAGPTSAARRYPKMAALLAEAPQPPPPRARSTWSPKGICLVIGAADGGAAGGRAAGRDARGHLLLPSRTRSCPPPRAVSTSRCGRLRNATGALGSFDVTVDALPPARSRRPRRRCASAPPRDGGRAGCDIILDLAAGTPLFPAAPQARRLPARRSRRPERRWRARPSTPRTWPAPSKSRSTSGWSRRSAPIPAPNRSAAPAASTSARPARSRPDGDAVAVDPMICAGCGACSARLPRRARSPTTRRPSTGPVRAGCARLAEALPQGRRQGAAAAGPRCRARARDDRAGGAARSRAAGRRDPARAAGARRLRACRDAGRAGLRLRRGRDPAGAARPSATALEAQVALARRLAEGVAVGADRFG